MSAFFPLTNQRKSNNLVKYCCQNAKNAREVGYNKLVTSGNNPKISKAMRYSQYVRTNTGRPVSGANVFSAPNKRLVSGTFVGNINADVLTIETITTGYVDLYQVLSGPGVLYGTFIVKFITGSGGTGTYLLNNRQSIPNSAMTATVVTTTFTPIIPRSHGRGFYGPPAPSFPITTRQPPGCNPCPVLPTL
jgi:hypothetical protein